jgi:predicted RNA binding protein YcfA (HicA-like mRNA interferase family)
VAGLFRGYTVETISAAGKVRVYVRDISSSTQLVVDSSAELLLKGASALGIAALGLPLRYERQLAVPDRWINVVLLPGSYAYTSYQAKVPVVRRYGRRLYPHVGPNIRLTFRDRDNPAFFVYYFNPNPVNRTFRLSIDAVPLVAAEEGIPLYDLWQALDQSSRVEWRLETVADDVISKALRDYEDNHIEKVHEEISTPRDLPDVVRFLSYIDALKFLNQKGALMTPGRGSHQKITLKGATSSIPVHRGDIARGTWDSILRDLKLKEEFRNWRRGSKRGRRR